MKDLLRFLGLPPIDWSHVTEFSITFHGVSPSSALLIAALVVSATIYAYFSSKSKLGIFPKSVLTVLRSLLLLMILLLLMRPVLLLSVASMTRRTLLVLIDSSASMQTKDLRQEEDDLKRSAIALGLVDPQALFPMLPVNTDSFSNLSRAEVAKNMLTNSQEQLLKKLGRDYDIVPFTFGQSLKPISSGAAPAQTVVTSDKTSGSFLDEIPFNEPATAIGDSVKNLLDLKRGQPIAGIFLVTDGGNNMGIPPLEAAALAKEDHIPLYIYGVGISAPHDIIVSQMSTPEVVFVKEQTPVQVTVRSESMSGRSARLLLKLGNDVVDSKDVRFGDDGEQVIPMSFLAREKGDYDLVASIDPLPDEAVKDNNQISKRVSVINEKIRVLYIEQKPRWEFRYLQAMLLRDRTLAPKFYLSEGDPELADEIGSPYLPQLPSPQALESKFDVVILGDVDPHLLTSRQMAAMGELVSNFGGGLVFLSGRNFMPDSYLRTPLETLLPVEFQRGLGVTDSASILEKLVLTPAGQVSGMMRLTPDMESNVSLWKELPGIYWAAHVTNAKPAAEVLLEEPTPDGSNQTDPLPVIAVQNYGRGQALFVGTDEIWRWRRNVGEKYYTRFWGQVLLHLGLPRLMGASRLTQLATDRKDYTVGERVIMSGRIYKSDFQPVTDETVQGMMKIQSNGATTSQPLTLRSSPDKPGYFTGEIVTTTPGLYTFSTDNDPNAALNFRVKSLQMETGDTALNVALLKKMAQVSGGAFYREEDLYKMLAPASILPFSSSASLATSSKDIVPDGLRSDTAGSSAPEEIELTFLPLYFALMILVVTVEWLLRKLWRLK